MCTLCNIMVSCQLAKIFCNQIDNTLKVYKLFFVGLYALCSATGCNIKFLQNVPSYPHHIILQDSQLQNSILVSLNDGEPCKVLTLCYTQLSPLDHKLAIVSVGIVLIISLKLLCTVQTNIECVCVLQLCSATV